MSKTKNATVAKPVEENPFDMVELQKKITELSEMQKKLSEDQQKLMDNQQKLVNVTREMKNSVSSSSQTSTELKKEVDENTELTKNMKDLLQHELFQHSLQLAEAVNNIKSLVLLLNPDIANKITKDTIKEVKTEVANTKAATRKKTLPVWVADTYEYVLEQFKEYENDVNEKIKTDEKYNKSKTDTDKVKIKSKILYDTIIAKGERSKLENTRKNYENANKEQLNAE